MDYRVGKVGKIIVARFENNEELLENITNIAYKERIKAGIIYLLGGLKKGKFVVGPENDNLPPNPIWRELNESHEILGIGTIFWQDNNPLIHIHSAYGKRDAVKVGCLRKDAEVFLVLEAIIIEIKNVDAIREFDPASGLNLLKLL